MKEATVNNNNTDVLFRHPCIKYVVPQRKVVRTLKYMDGKFTIFVIVQETFRK